MPEDEELEEPQKKKGLLVPLIVGAVLAGIGGSGGYWAATQGPFASDQSAEEVAEFDTENDDGYPDPSSLEIAFVELETLVVSLGPEESGSSLIFTAALEVKPEDQEDIALLTPRILDVLNSYLRVISVSELSEPTSLARLRAQMLRRIQVVVGIGRVRDLLVTQFLVN